MEDVPGPTSSFPLSGNRASVSVTPAKAFREIDEHFSHLVAGVQDYAIFLIDLNGHVLTWNSGAESIKGYRADEIIGQSFERFYPSNALAAGFPAEELKLALQNGRFEDEGWRIRKDGTRFWANVVITVVRDTAGAPRAFMKVTRDLTERKKTEEQLRRSEERFRLLVEGVRDYAIFLLDIEGKVSSWNAGAQLIKGYSAEEIIGKHFSCFYPSEDVASGKPQRELEVAIDEGRVEDEGWRVRKDRSLFWANVVITSLFDSEGRHLGFAKVTRDMTERRHFDALQHADRQKNDFLGMLAHELRNPLAPISTGLQLLQMGGSDDTTVHELTGVMQRQVSHLVRLVDDLLDVSRIINGKITIRQEPIELKTAITRAVEEVQPVVTAGGHELIVTMPARPIIVNGDLVRLSQVFSNLLTNAAKYTPTPSRLWISAEREESEATIRVRDPGIGIDPAVLPTIFNLFVQADHSLAHSEGGLGIGLTFVKRIVELHGGTIVATSLGLGQGTEFVLRLPVLNQNLVLSIPTSSHGQEVTARVKRKILVVDDNVDAAVSVSRLLRAWGHEAQAVFDGRTAFEIVRSFRPDILILDIGLPEMSGYEVAEKLRADPELKDLVIVALTGYGQAQDRQRSQEAGFDHHLVKPPDHAMLAALVNAEK